MSNKIILSEDSNEKEASKSQRQLEIEELRKQRIPAGVPTPNLDYPQREGYVRRVICDRHGRLEKMHRGGWRFVTENNLGGEHLGSLKAGTREGVDSRVSQVVGSHKDGKPMTGFLMEIPTELYDEDQMAKAEHLDDLEGTLTAGQDAGGGPKRGSSPQSPGEDGEYVGRQGIKIQQKGRRR